MDQNCASCANWETPDNLSGTCGVLSGVLRYAKDVWVLGGLSITTYPTTSCKQFEASEDAIRELEDASDEERERVNASARRTRDFDGWVNSLPEE